MGATVIAVVCCAVAGAAEDTGLGAATEQLDRLWDARANPDAVARAVTLGQRLYAEHPASYDLTWRLSRAYWRQGDLAKDESQRQKDYDTARQYAKAATELAPGRVEGHCYYALTTGDYGGTLSLFGAIREGIGSTFEGEMKRAYAIDRDFNHGTPMLALGRFYFELPWPKRDLDASRRYLEELKQRHPDALRGRLYLAETDHALGDDAAAWGALQYVVAHDHTPADQDIMADAEQHLRKWFSQTGTPSR